MKKEEQLGKKLKKCKETVESKEKIISVLQSVAASDTSIFNQQVILSVDRNIASKTRHLAEETSPQGEIKHPGISFRPQKLSPPSGGAFLKRCSDYAVIITARNFF